MTNWLGRSKRTAGLTALAGVLVLETAAVLVIAARELASRQAEQRMARTLHSELFPVAGAGKALVRPGALSAEQAHLSPRELIVGIEVAGRARAYLLSALSHPNPHLVNDLVGGVPVSVVFCDLNRCVRVYLDPDGSEPLNLEVAGPLDGEMMLKLGESLYFERTGQPLDPQNGPRELPYRSLTPTVTTWQEWVRMHPQTDVFVGPLEVSRNRPRSWSAPQKLVHPK
jgi:hypothetical protein